jgi:hypothetical protein
VAGNRDRLAFKLFRLFEGEAEGRFAIAALVFLVVVFLLAHFGISLIR